MKPTVTIKKINVPVVNMLLELKKRGVSLENLTSENPDVVEVVRGCPNLISAVINKQVTDKFSVDPEKIFAVRELYKVNDEVSSVVGENIVYEIWFGPKREDSWVVLGSSYNMLYGSFSSNGKLTMKPVDKENVTATGEI